MIQFPCTCGRVFRVHEDQAGGTIQCPACRKLNDIPLLSDLGGLAEDGTFRITGPVVEQDPGRIDDLAHIYHGGRQDHTGDDIDLRNTEEDLANVGAEYGLKSNDPSGLPHGPRYDPETGELVRAIDVKQDPVRDARAAPVPAVPETAPVIAYRARGSAKKFDHRVTPGKVPFELLRPVNLFVMFVIFFEHVLLNVTLMVVLSGMAFLLVAPAIMLFVLFAHYGCIVDEIGPEDRDELPRPLRSLGWSDDLWGPFKATMAALVLCYLPVFIMLPVTIASRGISLPALLGTAALALGGSFFFPAVFLTLTTSGTAFNLTPGRVMGVIARCGSGYIASVGLYIAAIATYGMAVLGSVSWLVGFLGRDLGVSVGILAAPWFAHLTLILAVYLMHLFCWRIGLLYRAHHEEFPWAFQFHVRTPRHGAPGAATANAPPKGVERAALIDANLAIAAKQRQAQADALRGMWKYQRP